MFSLFSSLGQSSMGREGFPYNPVRQQINNDDYVWDDNESESENDENFDDPELSELITNGGGSKGLPREVRFYNNSVNAYSHYSSPVSKWYNRYFLFFICGLGIYLGTTLMIRIGSFVGQNNSQSHGGGSTSSIIESSTSGQIWDDETDDDLMNSFDPLDTNYGESTQSIQPKTKIDDIDDMKINTKERDDNFTEQNTYDIPLNKHKEEVLTKKEVNGVKDEPLENLVERIVILGERNSGVNWFKTKIKECFPDIVVRIFLWETFFLYFEYNFNIFFL